MQVEQVGTKRYGTTGSRLIVQMDRHSNRFHTDLAEDTFSQKVLIAASMASPLCVTSLNWLH